MHSDKNAAPLVDRKPLASWQCKPHAMAEARVSPSFRFHY
jgi:hypothetical protein